MTQSLDLRRLQSGLAGSPLRFEPRLYAQVGSTQDLVAQAARGGGQEGLLVFADEQLSGRGRSGRTWIAPAGSSLMFSILLRPESGMESWPTLSLVAGLAVVEGLTSAEGPRAQLKWPNDCLCRERKLAGVLAESFTPGTGQGAVVVGVGCNVSWQDREIPEDLRQSATACDLEGFHLDRNALAVAILSRLAIRYREWAEGGFPAIRTEWLRHAAWIGREVVGADRSGPVTGTVAGITGRGELIVDTADGPIEIAAGDVEGLPTPQLRLAKDAVG